MSLCHVYKATKVAFAYQETLEWRMKSQTKTKFLVILNKNLTQHLINILNGV